MRPPNIELIFITNFQIVSLLKIAPYRMPKFGGYWIFSYLCTSNRKESFPCTKSRSLQTTHLSLDWCQAPDINNDPKKGKKRGFWGIEISTI